jgi:hypothetical protein
MRLIIQTAFIPIEAADTLSIQAFEPLNGME